MEITNTLGTVMKDETQSDQKKTVLDTKVIRRRRHKRIAVIFAALFAVTLAFQLFFRKYSIRWNVMLSDAFMIPGVIFLSVGMIQSAGYFGSLDLLSYLIFQMPGIGGRKKEKNENERNRREMSFPDYRAEREQNRIFPTSVLLCGLSSILLSIFFAVL